MPTRFPAIVTLASALGLVVAQGAAAVTFDFSFADVEILRESGDLAGLGGPFDVSGSIVLTPEPDPIVEGVFPGVRDFVFRADGRVVFDIRDVVVGQLSLVPAVGTQTILGIELTLDGTRLADLDLEVQLRLGYLYDPGLPTLLELPLALPEPTFARLDLFATTGTGELLAKGFDGTLAVAEPIPEPTAAFLFAGGLLVTAHHLRRRRPR